MSGCQFTWANRRQTQTFEKLDMILASVEWEQKYLLVTIRAVTRAGSDHALLLIDSGEQAHHCNKPKFSFELSWLKQDGFFDMLSKEWISIMSGANSMEKWQNKIRHIRSFLRGWAKNLSSTYKKEKVSLLKIIDELDTRGEITPLNDSDRVALRVANEKLAKLHRDEESKWAQRAKIKHMQEGGNNTKYFHLIANGKDKRKKIFQLEQDEGTIVGEENLKLYITEFYKKLFGVPAEKKFSLNELEVDDIPQLSQQENEILTSNFTEQEVHDAIFQMEKNKAPVPDGFTAEFYQK
jgi:hypothetical protein